MLIFEAWDMIANSATYLIENYQAFADDSESDKLREAFKITDGLMEMFLMKLDDMEGGKMTITRDEIWEAIGREE